MKHLKTFVLISLAVCSLAPGCKGRGSSQKSAASAADSSAISLSSADSLQQEPLRFKTDSCHITVDGIDCFYSVDYPVSSGNLSDAVRRIAENELPKVASSLCASGDATGMPVICGDSPSGELLVQQCALYSRDLLQKELDQVREFNSSAELSCNAGLTLAAETEKYLTYQVNSYVYLGGAHGSSYNYSFNISKESGSKVTEIVKPASLENLQPLLRAGVLSYFREFDSEVSEDNLQSYLLLEGETIPLPGCIYLSDQGVNFVYQQYEIAPYSAGLVSFIIPTADMRPYLTSEAAALLL